MLQTRKRFFVHVSKVSVGLASNEDLDAVVDIVSDPKH